MTAATIPVMPWVIMAAPATAEVDPVLGREATRFLYGPYETWPEALRISEALTRAGWGALPYEGTVDSPLYPDWLDTT